MTSYYEMTEEMAGLWVLRNRGASHSQSLVDYEGRIYCEMPE